MNEVEIKLHYRDGSNYKDTWTEKIPLSDFIEFFEGQDFSFDFIDKQVRSADIEIEWLGLSTNNIPMIRDNGFNEEYDHNFVTILDVKNKDAVKAEIQKIKFLKEIKA